MDEEIEFQECTHMVKVDDEAHLILKKLKSDRGTNMSFFTSKAIKESYAKLLESDNAYKSFGKNEIKNEENSDEK